MRCYRTAKKNRLSSVSVCRTNGNVTASGSLAEWGLHTVSSTPRFPSERGPRPCRNRDRYLLARKSQPQVRMYTGRPMPMPVATFVSTPVLSHRNLFLGTPRPCRSPGPDDGQLCHHYVTAQRQEHFMPVSCREAGFSRERGTAASSRREVALRRHNVFSAGTTLTAVSRGRKSHFR